MTFGEFIKMTRVELLILFVAIPGALALGGACEKAIDHFTITYSIQD